MSHKNCECHNRCWQCGGTWSVYYSGEHCPNPNCSRRRKRKTQQLFDPFGNLLGRQIHQQQAAMAQALAQAQPLGLSRNLGLGTLGSLGGLAGVFSRCPTCGK